MPDVFWHFLSDASISLRGQGMIGDNFSNREGAFLQQGGMKDLENYANV